MLKVVQSRVFWQSGKSKTDSCTKQSILPIREKAQNMIFMEK
jgi:hypothetical protein